MLTFLTSLLGHAATPRLNHVHPLNWWTGMKNPTLQVMLHGEDIGDCEVSLVEARNVGLIRVERVQNPNYLFVYLDIRYAQPQTFGIRLDKPGQEKPLLTQPYELKARTGETVEPFGPEDVVYLLMPDRFIDGNPALDSVPGLREPKVNLRTKHDLGRHGGDLAGIASALDYLQDLGVTTLWPTPVQVNDGQCSYHGYAITDYYQIDPRLGTNEEYRQLVRQCHDRGIKVVMDLVFNHCGSNNFLFTDLPDTTWFNFGSKFVESNFRTNAVADPHASQWELLRMTDGWFTRNMPDLNQRNPLVKDYLIQCSIWWTEYAKLNGIRQDTYPYADREMMRDWCVALDTEYPGYNVVGETWVNHAPGVAYWQKDSRLTDFNSQLPTVMDFPLMGLLNEAVREESDDYSQGLSKIYTYLTGDFIYADPLHLLTFLDNHDTDRFNTSLEQAADPTPYKQALLLLLTLRGIPQLYYGDEIGMHSAKKDGDGVMRQNFPVRALTAEGRGDLEREYHDYARLLLRWRRGCKAVQCGALTHYSLQHGCYVWSRSLAGERVTILMNGTDKEQVLDMERYGEVLPAREAQEVLTGKRVRISRKLTLKPRQSLVLQF